MSQITEQEAREAADRFDKASVELANAFVAGRDDDVLRCRRDQFNFAGTVIRWATEELTRRDAQRAELEKTIDVEWCVANGAIKTSPDFVFFRIPDAHNLNVYLDPKDPYVAYGSNSIPAITTRGQLRDLLAALKGGA